MLYVESSKSFMVRREKNKIICRVPNSYTRQTYFFAECLVLPSVFFLVYRVSNFAECFLHRLPSAIILPSVFFATLGKWLVCRVPEGMHSANIKTLGKKPVSVVNAFHYYSFKTQLHVRPCCLQPYKPS